MKPQNYSREKIVNKTKILIFAPALTMLLSVVFCLLAQLTIQGHVPPEEDLRVLILAPFVFLALAFAHLVFAIVFVKSRSA